MKKVFITLMAILAVIAGVSSCKCTPEKQEPVEPAVEQAELVVENLVSADRQAMFLEYGDSYRWFETCILLTDYLDSVGDAADTVSVADSVSVSVIEGVSNIFQAIIGDDGSSFDTYVISYAHTVDANSVEKVHGFWVEDSPLNEEEIKVTFQQAYDRLMEANLPKPHSKHVVLRKEVGPLNANPQYIFGNSQAQVYVDAVTGEVRNYNPVFPKNAQLNYAFSW